jgi:flagellar motor switch protein FliN
MSDEEAQSAEVQSAEEPVAVPEPEPIAAPPVAVPEEEAVAEEEPDLALDVATHLLDVDVRLWAELGRARLAVGQAVALGTGAIVDLDREPEDALDVFVNGRLFAKGRLLLVDGEWAVRLDEIVESPMAVEHASNAGSGA